MDTPMGSVHLVPNPDFVFPPRSEQGSRGDAPSPTHKRPVSMHLNLSPSPIRDRAQRKSVSALPTFTFNATDTSGVGRGGPEPAGSPTTTIPVTPSRNMGHRRRASEFVGGDSRYGVSTLVSTSPSKLPETLPVPTDLPTTGSPARRRGHAHRRSAAISGHDLASILQPRDANAAPQMALHSQFDKDAGRTPSPGAHSEHENPDESVFTTTFASALPSHDASPVAARPPSRPRVGFSENVEYIPRPLSTISSDTTSSASTVRGHSVVNSISSVISLGGIGTPSPRRSYTPPTMDLRAGSMHTYGASLDSRPIQPHQEEAWKTFGERPVSESAATSPNMSIAIDEPDMSRLHHKKRAFLKLDRRRSEPLIFAGPLEQQPGLSTVSLQEPVMSGPFESHGDGDDSTGNELNRKSSRRRVKDWANAFLGRKTRDPRKTKSMVISPDMLPAAGSEVSSPHLDHSPEIEPDLDAVFSQDPFGSADDFSRVSFGQGGADLPLFTMPGEIGDPSSMIDLDAALGPYGTPSMTGGRRQMHSGGFGRRGGTHNRTYSLPALTPFKFDRESSPVQSSMADVFEEDEEIETAPAKGKAHQVEHTESDDEEGTGIQIVEEILDNDGVSQEALQEQEHGLGIDRGDISVVMFPTSSSTTRQRSVLEDTILEETSPVEIVEDFEEPRTSSVTKSSDSSDSTILVERRNLDLPPAQPLPLTPVSISASAFSSPDYQNQQGFFDPSRLGTSASSMTDNRTISSFATGEHGLDLRTSVEDVPSLTSSRSTMTSGLHHTFPRDRRDFSDRSGSVISVPFEAEMSERRSKRSSIQSLSKLVGAPFGESRTRSPARQRPQTALPEGVQRDGKKRKENRLSKLMFWRSKGDSRSTSSTK